MRICRRTSWPRAVLGGGAGGPVRRPGRPPVRAREAAAAAPARLFTQQDIRGVPAGSGAIEQKKWAPSPPPSSPTALTAWAPASSARKAVADGGGNPSDNSLAVGPDHIVQIVNSQMAIFTKKGKKSDATGKCLYGPVNTNRVFAGFGDAGA